jgi:menaquinol-cytochrome c reductase cytochrome b/c subunit
MNRAEERRAAFQQYKQDVERSGKPFYPFSMAKDSAMSLMVVLVIIALTCIWYFSADGTEPGLLGPHYAEKADPGTTSFIPRPDWYFYFLFYLLRIFKWPESVILGTVGIPTLAVILLLALPFVDVRRERRLLRRPVAVTAALLTALSMGVLTYKGATARETLGSEALEAVPNWIQRNNLPTDTRQGAELFAEIGCLQCHTYLDTGTSNVGAPDLSEIGAEEGKDANYFARYVSNPSQFGNNVMPPYAGQGEENIRAIAMFLEASKGEG